MEKRTLFTVIISAILVIAVGVGLYLNRDKLLGKADEASSTKDPEVVTVTTVYRPQTIPVVREAQGTQLIVYKTIGATNLKRAQCNSWNGLNDGYVLSPGIVSVSDDKLELVDEGWGAFSKRESELSRVDILGTYNLETADETMTSPTGFGSIKMTTLYVVPKEYPITTYFIGPFDRTGNFTNILGGDITSGGLGPFAYIYGNIADFYEEGNIILESDFGVKSEKSANSLKQERVDLCQKTEFVDSGSGSGGSSKSGGGSSDIPDFNDL